VSQNGVVSEPPAKVRVDPPLSGSESDMLESWLDYHRTTLLMKCEGLSPEQLAHRAVPPSGLSLLGLVRHMTELELQWFQRVFGRTDVALLYCTEDSPEGDFEGAHADTAHESIERFKQECDQSRRVIATADSLDELGQVPKWGEVSLRWILVHVLEEYARHNGHADLLRECIDGSVGA
jgi:uncharacterized damage-inducible protein DinB